MPGRVEARLAWTRAPIYRARHVQSHIDPASAKLFALSGIGNPQAFEDAIGDRLVGSRRFPDHHAYAAADVAGVSEAARAAGADLVVTTEKDWVKLERFVRAGDRPPLPPIVPVGLEVKFDPGHDCAAARSDRIGYSSADAGPGSCGGTGLNQRVYLNPISATSSPPIVIASTSQRPRSHPDVFASSRSG